MNWWLAFALMTVLCWGNYGIALHAGSVGMKDPVDGRYKAFLLVGLMYFVFAVLAPLVLLAVKGGNLNFFSYPQKGIWWSCAAGILGAAGAFFVIMAFGAKGHPAVVMSIVFAGAPVVNAIVALSMHPPKAGPGSISPVFYFGILLAAVGGFLVTMFKPGPPPKGAATPPAEVQPSARS